MQSNRHKGTQANKNKVKIHIHANKQTLLVTGITTRKKNLQTNTGNSLARSEITHTQVNTQTYKQLTN